MRTFVIGTLGVLLVALVGAVVVGLLSPSEVTVQHRRFIAAEPEEVFKVVSNHDEWPQLLAGERKREIEDVDVVDQDGGGVGTERVIVFEDGARWRDMVSVYEPPYDLRFTGMETGRVEDWQNHILLQPGLRGGTVATFRVSYRTSDFLTRVGSTLFGQASVRHGAINFLENVAAELGVQNVSADQYALTQAQQRARDSVNGGEAAPEAAEGEAGGQVEAEGGAETPTPQGAAETGGGS